MVEIIGDSKNAVSALTKTGDAAKTAEGAAGKTTKSLAGIAKGVATGMAVGAVLAFGKTTVKAAEESEVAHQRLRSVMRGAGDSTGAATDAAEKYAGALSKATGIDDELISGAQSILATFHSVSGETGRTAGIFDRATAAAADLAAAGFGTLDGNAVQLGKALEDPTKGMAALAKSGVTFTDAQKEQIKAMQKSGDLLGAQKIVLGGVEDQVKGTAAATATESAKMSVAWGNFQESVGAVLLPFVDTVMSKLTGLFDFISANSSWLLPLVAGIIGLIGAFMLVVKTVEIVKTAIAGFKIVWMALNVAFGASPIGLIVIGIVALIAVIIIIATKTTWFQTIWQKVTSFMVSAWNATVGAITGAWNSAWSAISGVFNRIRDIAASVLGWIRSNWPLILGILTGPFGLAIALIYTYWRPITGFFSGIVSAIGGVFSRVISAITAPFITAFAIVRGIVDAALGGIRAAVSAVTGFVSSGIGAAKSTYNAFARGWNAIQIGFPGIDKGPIHIGGFTVGLPDLPMLQRGGYVRAEGYAYLHAAEVVTPAAQAGRTGPAVSIEHAHFAAEVDVDLFVRRLGWYLQTQRI
jgi:phage-related protein